MEIEREKRLNELLGEAFDRPHAERSAYLAEACGGDPALLEEALAFLEHDSQVGDFLETPASAAFGSRSGEVTRVDVPRRTGSRKPRGSGAVPSSSRPPASQIGQYRILDRIGEGGMGVVYRAEDTRLDRTVALKFLAPALNEDARAKARFLREARAASKLDHPAICTVHEVGESPDGWLYIVMACYSGESLRKRLERGALDVDDAIRITRQVASGLARAHREGIVHRDIKPANVFLLDDDRDDPGRIKVLDFGIAKVLGEEHSTVSGKLLGTPDYMAPEQLMGECDERSDIWALGVLLYEMVAGRRPFSGRMAVQSVLHDPLPPLAETRPETPRALCRVVERALAKNPTDRYQTVGALLAELPPPSRPIAGEESSVVIPASELRELRRPAWKRFLPAAALMALAAAVTAGSMAWIRHGKEPGALGAPALEAPATVAVLPFTVHGSDDFQYLREGMVDLLSTKLDGAGDLRAVDPRTLLGDLEENGVARVDRLAGTAAARRLDADLLVIGNVFELAGQLRLDATLYRVGSDEPAPRAVADASAEGPASEVFSLVDRLAGQLLASKITL